MTVNIYWQLDVAAEPARLEPSRRSAWQTLVRDVRTDAITRFDYYGQIGRAAAQTAFDGLFLPHRADADDSQIVAAAIAREVPRLRLIPQFPAWVGSAVYAAKQAVSFQRLAHERLAWAIAPDTDARGRAAAADHVADEQLGQRVTEFLEVARGVHRERPFTYKGAFFEVENGGFDAPLSRVPFPRVFFEGQSEEALALSARLADVHLFRDTTPETARLLIEALDNLAKREDRQVSFGLIQTIIAREDAEEARRDAAILGAPRTAIVGDYASVAGQLEWFAALGVTEFVLAGSPSLEEAYRVGQHVLPRFRDLLRPARAAA
jgi:alkanesulfonate monooxygenase